MRARLSQTYSFLSLPWSVSTEDHLSVAAARKQLDDDHCGLEVRRERKDQVIILTCSCKENQAANRRVFGCFEAEKRHEGKRKLILLLFFLKMVSLFQAPLLCFIGPPGTGKSSLGESIAKV